MDFELIDDFLPSHQFELLRNTIIFNTHFPWYLQNFVSYDKEPNLNCVWNWYATHKVYDDEPTSQTYDAIKEIFFEKLKIKSLKRIKLNFYPSTNCLREHEKHIDYDWPHVAAIYCLNTCDGFTRLEDGTIVESVENRLYTFDGSKLHNSTTTTNSKGRFNINFNFTR